VVFLVFWVICFVMGGGLVVYDLLGEGEGLWVVLGLEGGGEEEGAGGGGEWVLWVFC